MKIAYIIHAYKLPEQLAKLVFSLASENTYFFIHIDKKVDIVAFKESLAKCSANIVWVEREYSNWGSINCIKAVLHGLFSALENKELTFDYFYFLSGQDYPIKSRAYIEDFFEQNKETDFVKYFPSPRPIPLLPLHGLITVFFTFQ